MTEQAGLNELIEAFHLDKEGVLNEVYILYRSEFLSYASNFCHDAEMRIDCFQEAVISLYENLVKRKINHDSSSVKTYLFAIGKNKILNELRKSKRMTQQDGDIPETAYEVETIHQERAKVLLRLAFDKLGTKCQQILSKYYYHQYSIDAIMHDMNYKNENTVKAHKSRCVSQLRELMNTKT